MRDTCAILSKLPDDAAVAAKFEYAAKLAHFKRKGAELREVFACTTNACIEDVLLKQTVAERNSRCNILNDSFRATFRRRARTVGSHTRGRAVCRVSTERALEYRPDLEAWSLTERRVPPAKDAEGCTTGVVSTTTANSDEEPNADINCKTVTHIAPL